MTKLYAIISGYYSDSGSYENVDSIWTSEKKARAHILKKHKGLKPYDKVFKQAKVKDPNCWTNGDYWVNYTEILIDTEYMYNSIEEVKELENEKLF